MIDRAEATGFGVAVAGHAALFALLSLGFAATRLPQVSSDPIEVELVSEVGLETTAPQPSAEAPAEAPPPPAASAAVPSPAPPMPEPVPAPPVPQPRMQPMPQPAPTPRPVQRQQPRPQPAPPRVVPRPASAQAKPAAPKAAPKPAVPAPNRSRTSDLSKAIAGLADKPSPGKAATPPAAKGGPAVEASLVAEVRRQIKPHWQKAVPTGADAEMLRTELVITLSRSGGITGIRVAGTSGQTASNRPQVALHQERARRAVTLAAPYRLPAEYYENWKELTVTLDLRLSQ